MNLGTFVAMILFFTGSAVTVIGAIAWAIRYSKAVPAGKGQDQLSGEEVDAIRARLADLDQRDVRVEEMEERLDFVERALGRARGPTPLRNPTEK